jgi:hypothetical protein
MDLIVQGQITQNFTEPSLELVESFNLYWSHVSYSLPRRPPSPRYGEQAEEREAVRAPG